MIGSGSYAPKSVLRRVSPSLDNVSTEALMQELLDAIHQKVERIRALAARKLLPPADPQEEQDEKDQKERRAG